ncbi:hypothetical protein [Streptomyces sp. NPDC057696]
MYVHVRGCRMAKNRPRPITDE